LQRYTLLHNDIMSGRRVPRFVHCVLINGWGNVFQEAISCLVYALAAQRAVIFNTGPLSGYMPFIQCLDDEKLPFDGFNTSVLGRYKEVVIPRYDLVCLNFNDHADKELITIHLTYDFFAPNILANPHHGEKLLEIFPRNYFQILFHYLFPLSPDLQQQVDAFRSQMGAYTVGIQIRHPTVDQKGAKDHKGMPVPPLGLFAQVAEQLSRFQEEVPYEDVVWYMATQNLELIQQLQKAYGLNKIVWFNGTVTTTFDNDPEGQRVSLISWWLLGECDEVVTTEASSYGTTAAARTGIDPIVCNHEKFCSRRLSPTPCQDTPFPAEQPMSCLAETRKYPHQFMTSPDASCGHYKLSIYNSPQFGQDSWQIKQ